MVYFLSGNLRSGMGHIRDLQIVVNGHLLIAQLFQDHYLQVPAQF